ncbi:MAG TPA: ferredoxin [Planctomycetota bacterium]|nr:ferredoxin [Planctomycetota bacterium]
MASAKDKYKDNVSGPFYTDTQCIDCDLCRQTAPDFFDRNAKGGYSYVCKQPQTEDEIKLCKQALDECPVEAIGSDG